jgi:hypothetical protein
MASIKGTPGPWKIKHSESKKAFNIVSVKLGSKYKIARIPYECEGDLKLESASDAKIIAAAPELLEALNQIAQFSDIGNDFKAIVRMKSIAVDAIKKARE